MITSYLVIFTLAAALGQEPPQIVKAYATMAECMQVKQKLLHDNQEKFRNGVLFPACLRVVFEDA